MNFLDSLNPEQRQAVLQHKGPLLILAGAGTGKTKTITHRIAHMISCGISANNIAALTFTNKAAREMRERISKLASSSACKNLFVGTFHSFCLRILRDNYKLAGFEQRFNLVGTSDQLELVHKSMTELGFLGMYKPDLILSQIGRAKNELLEPHELGIFSHKNKYADVSVVEQVYECYERLLKLNHAIDFDDCIFKTIKLLQRNESLRDKYRDIYKYMVVDEYQDTNVSQLTFLELLTEGHRNLCVVGDDDQSIYSWRGAMYETIGKFEELFPERKLIKLEQNYRCSNVILDAANAVIQNNSQRKEKKLWSHSTIQNPITVSVFEDDAEEAKYVASQCMSLLGEGYQTRDICVLYRANTQAKPIELALREAGIVYKTYGGTSFFERKEIKDFLGYLKLILQPKDRMAFYRVINTPSRGFGLKTLEKIESLSLHNKVSPIEIIEGAHSFGLADLLNSSKTLSELQGFASQIRDCHKSIDSTAESFEALANNILNSFGLIQEIKIKTADPNSAERKVEALRSLPKWVKHCFQDVLEDARQDTKPEKLLDMLLDKLGLGERDISDKKDDAANHVSLMTIHAAKGLEFGAVFLIGCEEEIIPHKNSIADKEHGISEERRLFYVALTRAKAKVHLSYVGRRVIHQTPTARMPSRFLLEIPDALKQQQDFYQINAAKEEVKEQKMTDFLSALKSLKNEIGL